MKKLTYAMSILTVLLIGACKKDNANGDYYVTAKRNNENWKSAHVQAFKKINSDTVLIRASAIPWGTTLPEENFLLAFKLTGNGNVEAIKETTKYFTTVGLDVYTSDYKIITELSTPVTITSYDEKANTIKGTFNLSFRNTYYNASSTDILYFTKGSFYVKFTTPQ